MHLMCTHALHPTCPMLAYALRTKARNLSGICIHSSDMEPVTDLRGAILARISDANDGAVWTPADFLDLAGRDAVDKTLQRLAKAGALRRVERGLYDKPCHNTLTQRDAAPDPRQVIEAVARRDQIRVLVDGMTAANDLGLTNAVPAKIIVHTDARLKTITLEKLDIVFKPTAPSKLYWAGRPGMRVVQALHWLRDTMEQGDDDKPERRLQALLEGPKGDVLRQDLAEGLPTLPSWMQDLLRPLLTAGEGGL